MAYRRAVSEGVVDRARAPSARVRVAVVDDHRMVLDGLAAWLEQGSATISVVAAVDSWAALLRHPAHPCDVVLLDLDLGDGIPLDAKVSTLLSAGSRVVVVSTFADPPRVRAAVDAGVSGYVPKTEPAAVLVDAVLEAAAGRPVHTEDLAYLLLADSTGVQPALSAQERRALRLYASGLPLKSVARHLNVKYATAKSYIDRARDKYEAAGRHGRGKLDLHRLAKEDGLLPPDGPP